MLLHEGLRLIIQREAARRLIALGGTMPNAEAAPRRDAGRRRPVRPSSRLTGRPRGRPPRPLAGQAASDPRRRVTLGRHFKRGDATLAALLASRMVLCHPLVVGELALGQLSKRDSVLSALGLLPMAPVVPHDDVLAFVARYKLMGRGIGWIDVHLLASALVSGRVSLWSHDRRLAAAAAERGVAYAATAG